MCFQLNFARMTLDYNNHPLNSIDIWNTKTKNDLAVRQIKELRREEMLDAVQDYLEQTMTTARLEYLRDNWDTMTEIFEEREQDCSIQDCCSVCSKKAKKKCSICFQEKYCSNTCQSSHWKEHNKLCHYMGMMRLSVKFRQRFLQHLLSLNKDQEAMKIFRKEWKKVLTSKILTAEVQYQKDLKEFV